MQSRAECAVSKPEEQAARHRAAHDALTSLPNRMLFHESLNQALAQAERHGRRLAVMFIDLDNFKKINDTYGHDVGDQVLRAVSARLQTCVRKEDTVARQAGDEFLYLILEVKDERTVASAADKILRSIAQLNEVADRTLSVESSIGIALYPEDGESAEVLVQNADTAMYKAKGSVKRFVFYRD